MQRIFLFFAVFCVSMASMFAQDVITLKNGDEIQAIVQEIGEDAVKYKKFDNPNGPNYTMKKSEIVMIRYINGTKDVFQSENQVKEKENTKSEVLAASTIVSSIDKCDAKELALLFSIGFEVINNYQTANAEFEKTQVLLDYFSECAKKLVGSSPRPNDEELGAEIVKRIGQNSAADQAMNGVHSFGHCSRKNAKKMQDILTQEFEDWKTAYYKAEKALEENIDIIEFITPKYRYPLALSTMHELVINLRATTYKECADKYEEQFHRWTIEKNGAESIRIQTEIRNLTGQVAKNTKSIARSSKATAIFTGLMYLGL